MTDHKRDCTHPSWNPLPNGKVACAICGAIGNELRYIKLDDPQLDLEDTFTRMFALAEHWKNEALKAREERDAALQPSAPSISAEPPFCYVIPGDDTARADGWLDANVSREGEFTKPLYEHPRIAISAERVREIAEGVDVAMLIKGGQRAVLKGLVEAAIERALSEAGVRVEGE